MPVISEHYLAVISPINYVICSDILTPSLRPSLVITWMPVKFKEAHASHIGAMRSKHVRYP